MASIEGRVTFDEIPEPYVHVYLEGTSKGSSTNKNGIFIINEVPLGDHTLVFSALGFITKKITLTINEQRKYIQNALLVIDDQSLNEVVISGTMKPVSKLESPVPVEVYSSSFFKKILRPLFLIPLMKMSFFIQMDK